MRGAFHLMKNSGLISGIFPNFQKKRAILWGVPEFLEILTRNFRSILFFFLQNFRNGWLNALIQSQIQQFPAYLIISQELSLRTFRP